jgi:hypothetical protein
MRVGDLVRFKQHGERSPLGVVVGFSNKYNAATPSVYIVWSCEYTPDGLWSPELLEVANESR